MTRILTAAALTLAVSGCGFRSPFGETDQQILFAGDTGAVVCAGVVILATTEDRPEWVVQARQASLTARQVLLTSPASYAGLAEVLRGLAPPDYQPAVDVLLARISARASLGIIDPDSIAFDMVEAFLDACDEGLGVPPVELVVG